MLAKLCTAVPIPFVSVKFLATLLHFFVNEKSCEARKQTTRKLAQCNAPTCSTRGGCFVFLPPALCFVVLFCFALLRRSELSSVLFGLCREAALVCVGCWRLCSVVARILSGKVALRVALSGVASCLALLVVVVAVVVVVVTLIHLVVVVVGILGR